MTNRSTRAGTRSRRAAARGRGRAFAFDERRASRDAGARCPVAVGAPRICVVGPLPPPEGGMANQTRQLAELLRGEGLAVEIVRTNDALFAVLDRGNARGESRRAAREVCEVAVVGVRALRRRAPHGQLGLGLASVRRAGALDRVAARQGGRRQLPRRRSGALSRRIVAARPDVDEPCADRRGAVALPAQDLRPARRPGGSRAEHRGPEALRAARAARSAARVAARRRHPQSRVDLRQRDGDSRACAGSAASSRRAACRLPGAGPELERLRQMAIACGVGDAVAFVGRLDREAIAALYKSADIALNPSRVDNMPNSILEALASGVPVVSTQVGGVPYMVDHGRTALLVPPQEPQAMADGIARLLRDRDLAHRIASAGLQDVQQFGWSAVKDQWIDIYARLMPRVRGRARIVSVGDGATSRPLHDVGRGRAVPAARAAQGSRHARAAARPRSDAMARPGPRLHGAAAREPAPVPRRHRDARPVLPGAVRRHPLRPGEREVARRSREGAAPHEGADPRATSIASRRATRASSSATTPADRAASRWCSTWGPTA